MEVRMLARKAMLPVTLTRLMLKGRRAPLPRTPADVGMPFEDVAFQATDGAELRGWFIPSAGGEHEPAPAIVFVHGWPWNRLGNQAGGLPVADRDVDFLVPARALHDAGFHVLLFDLRNHGESASSVPLTFGVREAQDFAGAVAFLRGRPDVDGERIGALGCSAGANTVLYGVPACQPVRAVLAVQPTRLASFNRNFTRAVFGPIGPALVKPMELVYLLLRAPRPSRHDPAIPARELGETVVRYVQGTGDPWGTMADVEAMAAATPNALPLVRYPSEERYGGYGYIAEEADEVVGFFREHI